MLIHFKDEKLDDCLEFIRSNLKQDGRFFGNVNVITNGNVVLKEYPFVFRSLEFYENKARKHNLKIQIIGTLKDLGYKINTPEKEQLIIKLTKIE